MTTTDCECGDVSQLFPPPPAHAASPLLSPAKNGDTSVLTIVCEQLAQNRRALRLAVSADTPLWQVYLTVARARNTTTPFSLLRLPSAALIETWEETVGDLQLVGTSLVATTQPVKEARIVHLATSLVKSHVIAPVDNVIVIVAGSHDKDAAALDGNVSVALRAAKRLAVYGEDNMAVFCAMTIALDTVKTLRRPMSVTEAVDCIIAAFFAIRRIDDYVPNMAMVLDVCAAAIVPALDRAERPPAWVEEVAQAAALASVAGHRAFTISSTCFPLDTWLPLLLLHPHMPRRHECTALLTVAGFAYSCNSQSVSDALVLYTAGSTRQQLLDTLQQAVIEPALAKVQGCDSGSDLATYEHSLREQTVSWLAIASFAPDKMPAPSAAIAQAMLKSTWNEVRNVAAFCVLRRGLASSWLSSLPIDHAADLLITAALAWRTGSGAPCGQGVQYARCATIGTHLPLGTAVRAAAGGAWPTANGLRLLSYETLANSMLGESFVKSLPHPILQTARVCFTFVYNGPADVAWASSDYAKDDAGHIDIVLHEPIEPGTLCVAFCGCLHFFPASTLHSLVRSRTMPPMQCPFCKTKHEPDDGLPRNTVLVPAAAGSILDDPVHAAWLSDQVASLLQVQRRLASPALAIAPAIAPAPAPAPAPAAQQMNGNDDELDMASVDDADEEDSDNDLDGVGVVVTDVVRHPDGTTEEVHRTVTDMDEIRAMLQDARDSMHNITYDTALLQTNEEGEVQVVSADQSRHLDADNDPLTFLYDIVQRMQQQQRRP